MKRSTKAAAATSPAMSEDHKKLVQTLKVKVNGTKDPEEVSRLVEAAGQKAWGKLPFRERRKLELRNQLRDLETKRLTQLGATRHPSYREQLELIIEQRFQSAAAFCQATGLDPGQVSHVLSGDKAFSLPLLEKALRRVGYRLKLEAIPGHKAAAPKAKKR